MFLNQIRFIFIECVIKSNITIKNIERSIERPKRTKTPKRTGTYQNALYGYWIFYIGYDTVWCLIIIGD